MKRSSRKDVLAEPLERPKTLTASVAERIKQQIIDGSIPLGSMLSEKQIGEQFGTSKTPVREAFVQLQAMGLLTVLPQRGGMVFRPTELQVRELCEIRLELETFALRLAFARSRERLVAELETVVATMDACYDQADPAPYQVADNAFHMAFLANCGNGLVLEAYEQFLPRIRALRTHLSTPEPYLLERSLVEHRRIAALVAKGRVEDAAAVLGKHIARTEEFHTKGLGKLERAAGFDVSA